MGSSLRTRLMTVFLVTGLLAFVGAFVTSVLLSRERIETQMASHAQSVALTLSVALSTGDAAQVLSRAESLIEPVFDQSYLRRVTVRAADGHVVAQREAPLRFSARVPEWFARLLPLVPPVQRSEIMVGWRILGAVEIEPHPHWAQLQLWSLTRTLFVWLAAGFGSAALFAALLLTRGLAPLGRLREAAISAAQRRFEPIDTVGMPRELHPMVNAFNHMLESLSAALSLEAGRAVRYREQALLDDLTGLRNRRAFRADLESLVEGGVQDCWLVLLRAEGLSQLNHEQGRDSVDVLLAQAAHQLGALSGLRLAGRTEGACFAFVVTAADPSVLRRRLSGLLGGLRDLARTVAPRSDLAWQCGAAVQAGRADASAWLAAADRALHGWDALQPDEPVLVQAGAEEAAGGALREQVRRLISEGRIAFALQPTVQLSHDGLEQPLHVELRAALDDEGKLIRAADFLPYAVESGLAVALDSACLLRARQWRAERHERLPTVVNLGGHALSDSGIRSWMRAAGVKPGQFVLEFSETALLRASADAETFAALAQQHGFALGIKHFGLNAGALPLLRKLRPTHVKFASTLSRDALVNPETAEYVESLTRIASTLGILPVAVAVEDPACLAALQALGFAAVQGRGVVPERFDGTETDHYEL